MTLNGSFRYHRIRFRRGCYNFRYFVFAFIPFYLLLRFYNAWAPVTSAYTCSNCHACDLVRNGVKLEDGPAAKSNVVDRYCTLNQADLVPTPKSICTDTTGTAFSWQELEHYFQNVKEGGEWNPSDCVPTENNRVAIIIPYRDREKHLKTLLYRLHEMLQQQKLSYAIYVAEQLGSSFQSRFNRGLMKNIGYIEANKLGKHDCVFFHDVDHIPEDNRNIYKCWNHPTHYAISMDRWRYYRKCYRQFIGGVFSIRNDHFEQINGFSNLYFDWGSEDDDLYLRLQRERLNINDAHSVYARYTMLSHKRDTINVDRYELIKQSHGRMQNDGLNSLVYKLKGVQKKRLYTLIQVEVNESEVKAAVKNFTIGPEKLWPLNPLEKLLWEVQFFDWTHVWYAFLGIC